MWLNSQSQLSSLTLVAQEDYPRGIDKGGRPLSGTQLWVQVRPISLLHIQGYMIGDMYSHDMCSLQNMLYSSTYTFIGLLNNVQSSLDSLPEPDADWPGLWVGRYFRPLALGRVGPPLLFVFVSLRGVTCDSFSWWKRDMHTWHHSPRRKKKAKIYIFTKENDKNNSNAQWLE